MGNTNVKTHLEKPQSPSNMDSSMQIHQLYGEPCSATGKLPMHWGLGP